MVTNNTKSQTSPTKESDKSLYLRQLRIVLQELTKLGRDLLVFAPLLLLRLCNKKLSSLSRPQHDEKFMNFKPFLYQLCFESPFNGFFDVA
jgi:hypothetical protein